MSLTAAGALLALFIPLSTICPLLIAEKPLRPRNVKLESVERGLKVTWDAPNELDGRPVDRYSIGYGKSLKSLRVITVDKERRSEVLEDVEPGVLHFLKMSAENKDGLSKPVFRAETPRGLFTRLGPEWVKLDGFPIVSGSPANSTAMVGSPRPLANRAPGGQLRAPQSSSGPRQPVRARVPAPVQTVTRSRVDVSQPQADQRNQNKPKLASESVYVVSLQAQRALGRSAPAKPALVSKKMPPEPEPVDEAEDITARVMSPQSVLITWVDPLIDKKKKSVPEGSRAYAVRFREKGESARWEYKDTTQKRFLVEGLSADSMYEFSIRISQGESHGKWSTSVFQRTPESAPTGPPESFEVKPIRGKGTAVSASWDPPEEPNGRIREYILSYAPALQPFGSKSITYRGSTTSATIDGLQPGNRYIFKIRAVNRRGQGPQTKAIMVAMPTSTAASAATYHSSTSDRQRSRHTSTDEHDDTDEETRVTEEPNKISTISPPITRRTRPLSQTRSYHSIFSAVRSPIKNVGTSTRTTSSSTKGRKKENEEEEEPTDIPKKEDVVKKNDATDVNEYAGTPNNKMPSAEDKQNINGHSATATDTSRHRQRPNPFSLDSTEKTKVGQHITPGITSHYPSEPNSDQVRKPLTSISNEMHPEPKKSPSSSTISPSTSSSRPSSSPSLSGSSQQAASSKPSVPKSRHTGSGYAYINGRKYTVPSRVSRPVISTQKNVVGSSTDRSQILQSAGSSPYPSIQDTRTERNFDVHKILKDTTLDEVPTSKPATGHSTKDKDINEHDGEKEETEDSSQSITSGHSFRINPSLSGRGRSGFVNRYQPRKDGRIPWSRTAQSSSSTGFGRSIHPAASEALNTTDKSGEHSKHLHSKHSKDSGSPKPSESVLTKPHNRIQQGNPRSDNDHDETYLHEDTKKDSEKADNVFVTTAAPKPTASVQSKPYNAVQMSENESVDGEGRPDTSRPVPSYPRRSNGRSRSSVIASRQNGSRFPGRLMPAQHTKIAPKPNGSTSNLPSSSPHSQSIPKPFLTSDQRSSSDRDSAGNEKTSQGSVLRSPISRTSPSGEGSQRSVHLSQASSDPRSSSALPRSPVVGSRLRSPSRIDSILRGSSYKENKVQGQGKNGRPNLTTSDGKALSTTDEIHKENGHRFITGPDGSRWIVDLDKGVLMNEQGKVLQNSQGQPRRVVLGEDGRTIFDEQGTPLLNQDGMALFGHGRDTRPVVNPKEKYLTVGGKPIIGLDRPKPQTTSPTTTTPEPTTTAEPSTFPTTTEMTTLEPSSFPVTATCPPGTFSVMDELGLPMVNVDGVLDCYPEDEFVMDTISPPTTMTPTTPEHDTRHFNSSPSSEFDLAGRKRFTAPYVNYIRKDPGAPCSLNEALEYLQVDVLEILMEKDTANQKQPPKNKPHNITVVAMEGCHSFVIIDWARPMKDDMVSGYLVHSASYDDVLNNRWSTSSSAGTHLPVENLKPNSRYYFKVQARNIFGLGPISETITYVTESDDPLLIERPPGGEPIWIPFTFRYNAAHSACKGSQFVKRTWYRKFVGVVLCNSLRYKIFMGDGLRDTFHSIADSSGHGEDHCQFVDSYLDGRTGPHNLSVYLPTAQGYYRSFRQEPVNFGPIGRRTPHTFVGWYECGVPIPGKW
ncbi:fibronectin type III domain-containing protein 1 isoform X2 [Denticeps clupeoides]|uniref:Fibronectin type-III domain-containing protein n=1 Tax=Denticeps clupeoides TaxID=299321 RepID=A0AAY4B8P2_9TELE|nr:fibronectin type III domain-containing protein 1 isoform X2 [Denticeps clupeoides]